MKLRKNTEPPSKMENTKLQAGDRCVWYKRHGTLCFVRGGDPLRDSSGDDKFLIKPVNIAQFHEIMLMIAEASGLDAKMGMEDEKIFCYNFVEPKSEEDREERTTAEPAAR